MTSNGPGASYRSKFAPIPDSSRAPIALPFALRFSSQARSPCWNATCMVAILRVTVQGTGDERAYVLTPNFDESPGVIAIRVGCPRRLHRLGAGCRALRLNSLSGGTATSLAVSPLLLGAKAPHATPLRAFALQPPKQRPAAAWDLHCNRLLSALSSLAGIPVSPPPVLPVRWRSPALAERA
jgi:hypothetical protein